MIEVIQTVLIVIGAVFIIKGTINVAKGYNVDKLMSMFINKELPKIDEKKGK